MPYYVYRIREPKNLEYIDVKADYREARNYVRGLRSQQAASDSSLVRMVFAKTTAEAEKLLSVPKDTRVIGED